MAKDYLLEKRKFVIGGIAVFIVLTYILRLLVLQVMTDDYKKNADSNAFLKRLNIHLEELSTTETVNCWFLISQHMI